MIPVFNTNFIIFTLFGGRYPRSNHMNDYYSLNVGQCQDPVNGKSVFNRDLYVSMKSTSFTTQSIISGPFLVYFWSIFG